ncbi:uncharacterized protein C8orf88 homolog [Eucyclogobius newberryi]|uniref:uncharacterized protein C8orf88 homolog n=1 Tax=Eucyclogobius newberryi TaxID=166745 RepID=UPI003B5CD484
MEVSRRILQKQLEPARPLRRCFRVNVEPTLNSFSCTQLQPVIEAVSPEPYIGIEQFYQILNLHKKKKDRIVYSRDFLIDLADCPESRKRPEFLPEHPIVLSNPRDPKHPPSSEKWD